MLSLGIVDYDPLALYALRDLVLRSSERIRLLWSVRSRRAALRRLAAVEPVPDVILIDSELSDDSGRTAPLPTVRTGLEPSCPRRRCCSGEE